MKFKPSCIKCRKKYDSDDPDDYYCPDCEREKAGIAKRVDKILASRPKRKETSGLQDFNQIAAEKGGRGNVHVNIRDLGIEL